MRTMKLHRIMKGKQSLIRGALVVAIGIIVIVVVFSGVFQIPKDQNDRPVDVHMTSQELPKEVTENKENNL